MNLPTAAPPPSPTAQQVLEQLAELPAPVSTSPAAAKLRALLEQVGSAHGGPTWRTLAQIIQQGWIKGQTDIPPEVHAVQWGCLHLAWGDDPATEGLDHPLLPAALLAEAATGRHTWLGALAWQHAAALTAPQHLALLRTALRLTRRQHQADLVEAWDTALRPVWRGDAPWAAEWAACLAMRLQVTDDWAGLNLAQHWVAELTPLALARMGDEQAVPLCAAALSLATRCMDLPALRRLCPAALDGTPSARLEGPVVAALACLAHAAPDPDCAVWLDRAAAFWGRTPALQLERARWAWSQGADPKSLTGLIDQADPDHPGFRRALLWLANRLFHQGDADLAETLYRRADALQPLRGADRAHWAHVQVRQTGAPTPTTGSDAATSPWARWDLDPGPLTPALSRLPNLLALAGHHDGPEIATLQAWAAASEAQLQDHWPRLEGLTLDVVLDTARQLSQLAEQRYLHLAQSVQAFEHPPGPAYGQLDPRRGEALYQAVMAHVARLATLALDSIWDGPMRLRAELTRLGLAARLAVHDPHADAWLQHLGLQWGAVAQELLHRLREQAALASGDLALAQRCRDHWESPPCQTVALLTWSDWARDAPLLSDHTDLAIEGAFDTVDGQGVVQQHTHHSTPIRLQRIACRDLQLRLSFGLQNAAGQMLRPHPWHLTMGDYPYSNPEVLARGAAGAVLRDPARWDVVDEPVLVLANMDAVVHRNFYHWMLLSLPRVAVALDAGWLRQRRLMLPQELSGWMRSSLHDLGVSDDQICTYTRHQAVRLRDAWVLSPLEFASASANQVLRDRLWHAAGLDPQHPPRPTRLLYISRQAENRRPLRSEAALQALATRLGYEVIAPETLPLLEQVRCFAEACAVAGPPGAAFTNLLWAQADTRVLALYKNDVHLPTFVDLSLLGGQQHRWLLGEPEAGYERASLVNTPYDVNLALAERELRWAACCP